MKKQNVRRNRSLEWSFGFHAGLILLALFPMAQKIIDAPVEAKLFVEIDYWDIPETRTGGSRGLQASSPVFHETPQPTTESPDDTPAPVADNSPVEDVSLAEDVKVIESETISEAEPEVDITASTGGHGASDVTNADGGGSGSPIFGDQNGAAMEGDAGAGDGLEGDGIITRRVIHRENIGAIARENGRITFDICIDRDGKVLSAVYDDVKSTITDPALIQEATALMMKYRFERNLTAPMRECGQMTFIFVIKN